MRIIDFTMRVKRDFWQGVNKEAVGKHIQELERSQKALKEMSYAAEKTFGINEDLINEMLREIERELEYARFYFSHLKRQKAPDFNKWIYAENVKDNDHWSDSPVHNEWSRDNGKIKVIIQIKQNNASTRLSLHIKNAGKLDFAGLAYVHSTKELSYVNLRKKESIESQVEEYKQEAEKLFAKHQLPRYCKEKADMELVEGLLHVEKEAPV